MSTPVCRSCGARIRWARFTRSGKVVPLDADPVPGGNVVVVGEDRDGPLIDLVSQAAPPLDSLRYVNHFSTCPQADQWRRR
jgi:hypothetical protein